MTVHDFFFQKIFGIFSLDINIPQLPFSFSAVKVKKKGEKKGEREESV